MKILVAFVCILICVGIFAAPNTPSGSLYLNSNPTGNYSAVPIQAILSNQIPPDTSVACVGFVGKITSKSGSEKFYLYADKSSLEAGFTLNAIGLDDAALELRELGQMNRESALVIGTLGEIHPPDSVMGNCITLKLRSCVKYDKPTR